MSTVDTATRLEIRLEQARYQFPLPDGARRLIASKDFHGRTNQTLVRWLSAEPELAKRLLRWCNAPMFGGGHVFGSLSEAASVVENHDLARLAVLAWVRTLFEPDVRRDIYSRDFLWSHCVAVGGVASMIARTCGRGDASIAMVAGSLHDVGLMIAERLAPAAFGEVLSQIDSLSPTADVETDVHGWHHGELGGGVLRQWGMTPEIVAAAEHHHAPELADVGDDTPEMTTLCCVALANYFCTRGGWGSLGGVTLPPPDDVVTRTLGIDSAVLSMLWRQVPATIEATRDLR